MSDNKKTTLLVSVLGAGCAGLSLAARTADLPGHEISVVASDAKIVGDHIWGFWSMPWMEPITSLSRRKWYQWRIISHETNILHKSEHYPYCAISRHVWLQDCRQKALAGGARFVKELDVEAPMQQILDSRPPPVPEGTMLQHFSGWEVRAPAGSFDASSAILMDFRCDQSRGMHFIYCLPFSDQEALIESTLFTPDLAPADFYESAIVKYIQNICHIRNYDISRRESGVIPLGILGRHDPRLLGIGANGGAIRPSSGYAFSFIQKQIDHAVKCALAGKPLPVGVPHSAFELWMDRIFLAVLRRRPDLSPNIFTSMARALNGDEFARFLSGEAGAKIWLKVIMAMPKKSFLLGMLRPEPRAVVS